MNNEPPKAFEPWEVFRGPLPASCVKKIPLLNGSYRNTKALVSSDEYKRQEALTVTKVQAPGWLRRTCEALVAGLNGKTGHGWSYEQMPQPDGTFTIKLRRLFVSNEAREVANTRLPTRQVELYELRRQGPASDAAVPDEVRNVDVFLPEGRGTVPARQAGGISRIATIDCHELGSKYLLYRAPLPETSTSSGGGKRKLVVDAHGNEWLGHVEVPPESTFAFAAPAGHLLLTAYALNTGEVPPYSEHSTKGGIYQVSIHGRGDTSDLDGGRPRRGAESGAVPNLVFTKRGSPIHDASSRILKHGNALNNPNEGAAWLAHDLHKDVITLRHSSWPAPIGGGSLAGLTKELQARGLLSEYDEIFVHACRPNSMSAPVYGIGNNLEDREA